MITRLQEYLRDKQSIANTPRSQGHNSLQPVDSFGKVHSIACISDTTARFIRKTLLVVMLVVGEREYEIEY